MRAQGLDRRVIIKEFSGKLALDLAESEWESVGVLQSDLIESEGGAKAGSWVKTAATRSANLRQDDNNVARLIKKLQKAPFLGIIGEVNLAELEGEMDPNEFYRAMGVTPPKPGSIWVVYEYAGLTSLQAYSRPASLRRANIPMQKGIFGNLIAPPALPPFTQRAQYVRGIMKQSLEAIAKLHALGICHRSVGRSSLVMGCVAMDKNEATSPYAVEPARLVMKMADFGFSDAMERATYDDDFCRRARMHGLSFLKGIEDEKIVPFCMAEDLHALGFVFTGLLLTALADVKGPKDPMPATDEDTLQRQLGEIFEKDIELFRDYIEAEEIWADVVEMMDQREGWDLLNEMCFSRESVKDGNFVTAQDLLKHPFFTK